MKSRRMRWKGHVDRMEKMRNTKKNLVGKPEGRRPLGRPRHRKEENIKMDLREIGFEDVDLIHVTQYRDQWRTLVNKVIHFLAP
jgi:hypothetical protein